MDKLVYLTYPAILALLFVGSRWAKKGEWNDEFMSLKQTKYIQGFMTVCIMLHHVAQETCASWQSYALRPGLEFFVDMGYLFVAVFFFCSGYGLFKSYKGKDNYLKGFFSKRIEPLIVAFYVTGWIYLLARALMKESISNRSFIYYVIGWGMPNQYSWFVIAMPFFYLCFYLSFRFLKSDFMKIAGTVLGVFLYTLLGTCAGHPDYWMRGEWWYNSVHLFWIGLIFAKYEGRIVAHIRKWYVLYFVLAFVGAYALFIVSLMVTDTVSYYGEYNPYISGVRVVLNRWICLFSQMLASTFFVLAVLVLNLKLKIGNRLLSLMGGITLEFYLMHGLILELFARQFCDIVRPLYMIKNVALLEITVLILGIAAAFLVKFIDRLILKPITSKKK